MTGYCRSQRAKELLNECAEVYSSYISRYSTPTKHFGNASLAFSAIEYYIVQDNAKNEELIQYLKGEIDSLNL